MIKIKIRTIGLKDSFMKQLMLSKCTLVMFPYLLTFKPVSDAMMQPKKCTLQSSRKFTPSFKNNCTVLMLC